jgi:hypothetical protein
VTFLVVFLAVLLVTSLPSLVFLAAAEVASLAAPMEAGSKAAVLDSIDTVNRT